MHLRLAGAVSILSPGGSTYLRASIRAHTRLDREIAALDRARAAVPRVFGLLPKADCVVARIPDYEAPYTYLAYYRPPNPDGTKPGELFINVFQPQTRSRSAFVEGWAIDFMLTHTALTPGNIDNEVDRYISWPGQALAYKMGQIEILELRRLAFRRP